MLAAESLGLYLGFVCLQLRVLDFMVLSLGIVATQRAAATQLQAKRPPQGLCCVKTAVLVLESILIFAVTQVVVLTLLTRQPWFTGTTGQNHEVKLFCDICMHGVSWCGAS